jgi:hypothetical protein
MSTDVRPEYHCTCIGVGRAGDKHFYDCPVSAAQERIRELEKFLDIEACQKIDDEMEQLRKRVHVLEDEAMESIGIGEGYGLYINELKEQIRTLEVQKNSAVWQQNKYKALMGLVHQIMSKHGVTGDRSGKRHGHKKRGPEHRITAEERLSELDQILAKHREEIKKRDDAFDYFQGKAGRLLNASSKSGEYNEGFCAALGLIASYVEEDFGKEMDQTWTQFDVILALKNENEQLKEKLRGTTCAICEKTMLDCKCD